MVGLGGTMNAQITKLVLGKHGYSDKVEQDLTTSDGSMKPVSPIRYFSAFTKVAANSLGRPTGFLVLFSIRQLYITLPNHAVILNLTSHHIKVYWLIVC